MPPLLLVWSTTSSTEIRSSAPSMAPTPVMSSRTPTLIGVPVGLAAAGCAADAPAAAGEAAGDAPAAAGEAAGDAPAAAGDAPATGAAGLGASVGLAASAGLAGA